MRWIYMPAIAMALTGCVDTYAGALLDNNSTLEPTNQGFRFATKADGDHPLNSADGEKMRMAVLDRRLKLNGLCQKGYTIENKSAVVTHKGPLGIRHDVFYYGRCK